MNGFEAFESEGSAPDSLPQWLTTRFDPTTTLPVGPLEHLPIPLEGSITGGWSTNADEAGAGQWQVNASCKETVPEVVRFYEEFLPLTGYIVRGSGSLTPRVRWRKTAPTTEFLLIKRDAYLGLLTIKADLPTGNTLVTAEMTHPDIVGCAVFADPVNLMSREIVWRYVTPSDD